MTDAIAKPETRMLPWTEPNVSNAQLDDDLHDMTAILQAD